MPSKGHNKPKKQEDLKDLCLLISQLDGLRVFQRVKPEIIKDAFEKMKSKDLEREWKKIRHDVEEIVYLPTKIQGLGTLVTLATILKLLIPASLIFVFLARVHFIVIITLAITIPNVFIITDFIIRRKIAKYEEKHKEKFSKGKERIKEVTQRLILELMKKVKRSGGDPADYKIKLLFKDYKGIKIIKESRGRIFKKKYPNYTVIPSI